MKSTHIAPIDSIKIHPSKIVKFCDIQERRPRTEKAKENEKNLTRGKFNGYLSYKSKKQITERLEVWLNGINQHKKSKSRKKLLFNPFISFITLTLPSPQAHTDQEIKRKCLNNFILWMREQKGVLNYYWRAEPQKNGNIHFHILADKFINHLEVKERWNTIINLLNYVDVYSTKFQSVSFESYKLLRKEHYLKDKKRVLKAYQNGKKCNWTQPNSTDIHKLQGIRNITAYITKYMTKGDESRVIQGRLTGCSDSLRDLKQKVIHCDSKIWDECFKMFRDNRIEKVEGDYFQVFYFNSKYPMKIINPKLFNLMLTENKESIERMYAPDIGKKEIDKVIIKEVKPKTKSKKLSASYGEQINLFSFKNKVSLSF